jgi:integrase
MKASTIRGIHSILSGAFAAAQRWEWTERNPAASAKPPTTTRKSIAATSPEDVAKVIAQARARSAALGLYLWLVVITGVRRGELCGLQICDIDLDLGTVHVAFNYVVRGGQRVRKDTKTHQDRWLAIDPETCALIVSYLDETRAALAAVGVELRDDAYLFSNDPSHARRGTLTGLPTRSRRPRRPPGRISTLRAAGTTPPASSWPAASTCATRPPASATAAVAPLRCGTTPGRSRR